MPGITFFGSSGAGSCRKCTFLKGLPEQGCKDCLSRVVDSCSDLFPAPKFRKHNVYMQKPGHSRLCPGFELQQRFHRLIFAFCASGFISRARTFHLFAMVLQCVKLIVSAVFLKQLMMIALFNDFSV